jgi:hypothetical protein
MDVLLCFNAVPLGIDYATPHGRLIPALGHRPSRKRTRGIKICSVIYANAQTVNQLPTEPAGKQSSTDDEQQNYDDLAAGMQQADALRAGVAGNCPSVDQSAAFQLGCLEPDTVT